MELISAIGPRSLRRNIDNLSKTIIFKMKTDRVEDAAESTAVLAKEEPPVELLLKVECACFCLRPAPELVLLLEGAP